MMFLLQGQSDPLMPDQRKANLKYQSPVDIFGVKAKCISKVIGWFKIGSCDDTCSEEGIMVGPEAIVLVEFELMSRTLIVLVCPLFVSISASGFAVITYCIGLSASGMSSALS